MTELVFNGFSDYKDSNEDGKVANLGIDPTIIVFIDNSADVADAVPGDSCRVDIRGVSYDTAVYQDEEEFWSADPGMEVRSVISTGTFFSEESPWILFCGKVLEVDYDPDPTETMPNCQLLVDTYGFEFYLYIKHYDEIHVGSIVKGSAWLFGDMEMIR